MWAEVLSVLKTFWEIARVFLLGTFWQIIKNWWWLVLPFILVKPFLYLWHWWRFEVFLANVWKPVLLEIRIPRDIMKPIRAMEDVMSSLHGIIYHPPDWWEEWIEGQFQTSLGLEITSIEGKIHFYIRIHEGYRESVEAAIYAQYPEVEITKAEDYTKAVPQDIPNKNWDLWGSDYQFLRSKPEENAYPILTYKSFETGQERIEEKRIDPVAGLMEAMAKIGPGEQLWVQISATPVTDDKKSSDWRKQGFKLRNKLAKREEEESPHFRPMVLDAADILLTGKVPEPPQKPERDFLPPEMKLTPGERDIVAAVEEKLSKAGFSTSIRFIYLGKRENFIKNKLRLAFTFFASFYTHNLNALIPSSPTITKIKKSWFLPLNLFRSRRMHLRQRKLFRHYVDRTTSFFPRGPRITKFILNIEELASIFHFPSWQVSPVPGVSRIESKKKAPPDLPQE